MKPIEQFKALEDACWILSDRTLFYSVLGDSLPELDGLVGRDILYRAQYYLGQQQEQLEKNTFVRKAAARYRLHKAGMA